MRPAALAAGLRRLATRALAAGVGWGAALALAAGPRWPATRALAPGVRWPATRALAAGVRWPAALALAAALAAGCAPEPFLFGPDLGDPCRGANDCATGLCLSLGHPSGVGVCTNACRDNWDCRAGSVEMACLSGYCVPDHAFGYPGDERARCGVVGPARFGECDVGLRCVAWADYLPTCARACATDAVCDGTACLAIGAGVSVCGLHP